MSFHYSNNELQDMSDIRYMRLHMNHSILETNTIQEEEEEAHQFINLEEDHKSDEGFIFFNHLIL